MEAGYEPGIVYRRQNLLNNWHLEFMPDFVNTSPTVVKRSIFGSITVKF